MELKFKIHKRYIKKENTKFQLLASGKTKLFYSIPKTEEVAVFPP